MTQRGTMQEHRFFSEALQEELQLLIYLPAAYTPLHKHTLLIAQDGSDYWTLGKIGSVLEALQQDSGIDRTIFVGIPYRDVHDRKRKYFPGDAQNKAYIRFLAQELVPFLDAHYPTYGIGRGRVLMGDSLGGTVSLMAALTYPHTFGKVIMQSPFVNDDVLALTDACREPYLLELYQEVGTEETAVRTTDGQIRDFVRPNRELKQLLGTKGFSHSYEEFDGDHTWTYWQQNLPGALARMLAMK
ncbi:alpha/beta hydrolase [Ectobacillus ponti]|uniref:Alpha/beta hydrolase-fold protein n=1 Tax=Ectobacillus ponti TaxID=2961894 RepID=A0AA41X8Q3_9BACI|nr:alpha/beta hydrolase-fold protein [Ectobacillus ponti]MCP8968363.1 alpha/beta hydrolase-fold protein [Ectobacillus ponti]